MKSRTRQAGRRVVGFLGGLMDILRNAPAPVQRVGNMVLRRLVLARPRTPSLIDAAAMEFSRPLLWCDMAGGPVYLAEPDHGRYQWRAARAALIQDCRSLRGNNDSFYLRSVSIATSPATRLPAKSKCSCTSSVIFTPSSDGCSMP
jgi:hypothetical protein